MSSAATAQRSSSAPPPLIAVDAMGGDHAPREVVAGAAQAVREHGLRLVLVGRTAELAPLVAAEQAARELPIVHAEEALAMHEGALAAWRRARSSVAVGCKLIRQGTAAALVSAGSTGGVVSAATVRLRTLPGVLRPALALVLPTRPTPTVLLDAGANADAKPEMLVQFAQLGTTYAELAHGVAEPRVGLLTIGSEAEKGNKVVRRAHELLQAAPGVNFAGNVEGHDLLTGKVDVIASDGFTGNVALKTMEGAVRYAFTELREAIGDSRLARLGAALQRSRIRELRRRLDAEAYGGAVLLGLNGTVVIAHGASKAQGISAACRLAADLAAAGIVPAIGERMSATGRPHRLW